jgi:hypothetical protein
MLGLFSIHHHTQNKEKALQKAEEGKIMKAVRANFRYYLHFTNNGHIEKNTI